jgi:ABC-type Na+ efflux pump permease subunit
MYKYLPALTSKDDLPYLLLYDPGESALAFELEASPNLIPRTYDSLEAMQRGLVRADRPEIGLDLPADLDRRVAEGGPATLAAYTAYWIPQEKVDELVRLAEGELSYYAGTPVRVALEGTRVYPQDPGAPGSGFMISVAVVMVVTLTGVVTVTHLILEEKRTRTIDALRVSPATPAQLVLAKALVGGVYCLLGVGVVYALNGAYVMRWDAALLAALLGSAFGATLGTLLGLLFETQQQVTLWGFMLMSVLLLPTFFIAEAELLPAGLVDPLRWLPTSLTAWLVRASFAPAAPLGPALLRTGALAAEVAVLAALGAWRVRALDR